MIRCPCSAAFGLAIDECVFHREAREAAEQARESEPGAIRLVAGALDIPPRSL